MRVKITKNQLKELVQESYFEVLMENATLNEARQLAFDRAIKAGATPSGARVAAEALDFIPGVGEGLAARDVYQSLKRGDYLGAGIHGVAGAMGVIPVVGDVAGKAVKAGAKKLRKSLGSKSEEISEMETEQK